MPTLLIQGGRVISPTDGLDAELDLLLKDGLIAAISPDLKPRSTEAGEITEVINAHGQIVAPGFIDLHVHLRDPGGNLSETLETGLSAAVAGGFTAVCPMPNTLPVNDSVQLTRSLVERAGRIGLARVFPIAAISEASEGDKLTDFRALAEAGAVAFSDDGRPVKTARLMRDAMEAARSLGMAVIDHCEDLSLSAGGVMNEGSVAENLGVGGVPDVSEEVCLARDLVLAAPTGARLHVAHISTLGSVELVRRARQRGVSVTAEATPHHFTLTDEAVLQYGSAAKMNPPLGTARDLEGILQGLADGTIDAIATDHAPHAPELKAKSLAAAPFGVIGLETALGLGLTFLVHTGRISFARLIALLSANPARIINRPLGRLAVGAAADITVFAPDLEWTYRVDQGRSKSRNSPFDGWKLKGAVMVTIVAGNVVYRREST